MIEWIDIRNFQNLKRLLVEFSPHVNTFVGDTGAGKSAVLRAFKWLLINRPLGKSYVGNWRKAKYVKVTARIDGKIASHLRRGNHGVYRLRGQRYKAFGSGLPDRLADLFNVSHINFQNQIEAPLWFTLPPIKISRQLNSIINLKDIDKALQLAASRVRQAKAAVAVSSERLQESKASAHRYRRAPRLRKKVLELQRIRTKRVSCRLASTEMSSLIDGAMASMKRIKTTSSSVRTLLVAIQTGKAYRAVCLRVDRLGALVNQLDRSRALAASEAPNIDRLAKRYRAALAADKAAARLHGLWLAASGIAWEVNRLDEQIESLQTKLKSFKGRCSQCGQKLKGRNR